jgi:antitoxin CptB
VTASAEIRRKRLLYRSWHRGTRESDLIFGRFAAAYLAAFDDSQLDRYEALLDCADVDLFDWVGGRAVAPAAYHHDVLRLLLAFTNSPPGARPDQAGYGFHGMSGEASRPLPLPASGEREGPAQREGEGRRRRGSKC